MKKNWMLRLGLLAMVLTLVTMPMVSSTYAKYVTAETGSDTARVAKWGVEIVAPADGTVFDTEYDTTVLSSTADNVVAPGTTGSFAGVTITGTPEVDVQVTYVATLDLGDAWVDSTDNYYCPIIITVNTVEFYGLDYASADAFETAVKGAIEALSANYTAGTDLATITGNAAAAFTWEWDYESTNGTKVNASDVKDTFLGGLDPAPTISLEISVTVTQIN